VAIDKSAQTDVTLAFCWSHVRRGFYDLAKAKAPIATETLQRIAALYEIEAGVRGKSAADRLAVRQAESKPLVAEMRVWFEEQIAKLPARGPTAEAIRYALNHWDGLERFLEDGRIELGRVDDWRSGGRSRGELFSGGFHHAGALSIRTVALFPSRRSSNRTCRFPASGFLPSRQTFALGRSMRRRGTLKRPSVS
jgi:hypothetical protein